MTGPAQLTRRRALGLLAGTGAAGLLGACSASSTPSPRPTRSVLARPTLGLPATPSTSATTIDWAALARRLHGELRRESEPGYVEVSRLFDPRFDHIRPTAVASVASPHDIAHCIDFARRYEMPISIRSGGHSYVGASTGRGLVIDVRPLNAITVGDGTATVGAGAALVDVYSGLATHGVSIPAGSCPTVGLSGLALGGGVGVVARQYGLTCDRIVSATVVTADGETVTANAGRHSDLYWALRGGGGSFGVVTDLTLTTHPATPLSHAFYVWPWSAAASVVSAWQMFAAAAPTQLWSACHILAPDDKTMPPNISVPAVYVGPGSQLAAELGPLLDAIPVAPTTSSIRDAGYEATMLLEAGCADLTPAECRVGAETPGGRLEREAFVAGSDYFRDPIPFAGIDAMVRAVAKRAADRSLGAGGVSFDVLGGAVDDLAPDATAYVHRGALFNAQYTAGWSGLASSPLSRNQRSLAEIRSTLHRYGTGQAYQNYADAGLRDPQRAYYGDNLPRLVDVKQRYDPANVFNQPQGIPTAR